jgi:AcrR family transcriptional regulator
MTYGHACLEVNLGARSPASPHPTTPPAGAARPASSPRAGRRERRAAETREKIFRAALDLFAREGFSSTTVEDITEAADVGKGTFFNYFPSKEHIFAAFGDVQLSKVEALREGARRGQKSMRALFRRFVREITAEPGRSPRLLRAIWGAILSSQAVHDLFCERTARGRALLAEVFRIGQRRGEIRRDARPAVLARLLQQSFFGTMLFWCMEPAEPLESRVAQTFEMLWPAIGEAGRRS